jgi:hypothetical protein
MKGLKKLYDPPKFVPGQPFNRARASGSNGPRTGSGSGYQRLNAFKHGMFAHHLLLPGEDPSELHRHKIGMLKCLNPNDTFQQLLAERIICAAWKLRRMEQAEQELYAAELNDPQNPAKTPGAAMVRLMKQSKPGLISEVERIQKYQHKLEGTINRNIQLMHKLQFEGWHLNGVLSELTGELIEEEEAELKKIDPQFKPEVLGCGWHDENEDLNVLIERKKQQDKLAQREIEEPTPQEQEQIDQDDEPQQDNEVDQEPQDVEQSAAAPAPAQKEDPAASESIDFRDISAKSWNKTDQVPIDHPDAHRVAV